MGCILTGCMRQNPCWVRHALPSPGVLITLQGTVVERPVQEKKRAAVYSQASLRVLLELCVPSSHKNNSLNIVYNDQLIQLRCTREPFHSSNRISRQFIILGSGLCSSLASRKTTSTSLNHPHTLKIKLRQAGEQLYLENRVVYTLYLVYDTCWQENLTIQLS